MSEMAKNPLRADYLHSEITYPVLICESRRQQYSIMDIVRAPSKFITFSRMPKTGKFIQGQVFDSSGRCFGYAGECGWPRFGKVSSAILEALVIPTVLSKIQQYYTYFGPRLISERAMELGDYKQNTLAAIHQLNIGRKSKQLERLVWEAQNYKAVIEAVDWWRYNGGKRDPDGHPIGTN